MKERTQDLGLEEVTAEFKEKMVNSRKTCFREQIRHGGDKTGMWRYRLKHCAF